MRLSRTLKYASALKKRFGKKFHIHIYLPTKFATSDKLKKLAKYIDEVRFHPEFLSKELNEKEIEEDVDKIKTASKIFGKENTGIELPMIPEKKREILNFILLIRDYIGFVNLNELELGDTNFNYMTSHYKLDKMGYVIKGSLDAGKWLLNELKKHKVKLNVHLCTAELKNWHQYKNRLLRHKIMPFGKRTEDGSVVYYSVYSHELKKLLRTLNGKGYLDKIGKRIIVPEYIAEKLILQGFKVKRVEEYPTFDRAEIEVVNLINPAFQIFFLFLCWKLFFSLARRMLFHFQWIFQ